MHHVNVNLSDCQGQPAILPVPALSVNVRLWKLNPYHSWHFGCLMQTLILIICIS